MKVVYLRKTKLNIKFLNTNFDDVENYQAKANRR
jgi:hypothetical protein